MYFLGDPGGTSVLEIWTWRYIRVQTPSQCIARTGDKNSSKDGRNADSVVGSRVQMCFLGAVEREGEKCPFGTGRWVFQGTWPVLWFSLPFASI